MVRLCLVMLRCKSHAVANIVLVQHQEVNHTGRILYTEFLASTLEVQGNVAQSKITEAFNHLDRDSKGYIDKGDLRQVLPSTMTDREIDALISEAGADSGGRVSLDQFRRALRCETQRRMSQMYEGTAP